MGVGLEVSELCTIPSALSFSLPCAWGPRSELSASSSFYGACIFTLQTLSEAALLLRHDGSHCLSMVKLR